MVVANLEAYERIPIFRDVKTYITSFLENPGTTEELIIHLQSEYQDTRLFNFALYTAIKYLQEAIVEHRNKKPEDKSESLKSWEGVSYDLQEGYLRSIIQHELEQYSELLTSSQIDILNLKELIYFKSNTIIIIPSLIEAKEMIDSVLDRANNEIEKLENIQALLFYLRHQEETLRSKVFEVTDLEFVPLIQLYDEYCFNLEEIKRMLFHYQELLYSKSYVKLKTSKVGNTFRWDGTEGQLKKLYDTLKNQHISPETNFDEFRLLFSSASIEGLQRKIVWVHTAKSREPNRLSLKSLIYALIDLGLISSRYRVNPSITNQILEECFLNEEGEPFRDFRKSPVEFESGSAKEMLDLVKSIK